MRIYWILVADAGRARIFAKVEGIPGLALIHELDNPAGREHGCQLVSDASSRVQKHSSNIFSAMDPRTSPHEHQASIFAHRLAFLLEGAALQGEYQSLVQVAPAHLLGLLRNVNGPAVRKRIHRELALDLTHHSPRSIECSIAADLDNVLVPHVLTRALTP